jgi:2-amino-4-hydroxy-6-hydroxymethyldihydropteridine diphosphokinase
MATSLIALGSNLGDRTANLQHAVERLDAHPAVRVVARSRSFFTPPVGGPGDQDEYVNAAARVETTLTPDELFDALRNTETQLGRQRRQRWAARVVDLDLLLFDHLVIKTPRLEIPHPRMAFRRFVLEPAAQIASDMVHPVIGWTIRQLFEHLQTARGYIALTGLPATGKSELARAVAARTSSRYIADPVGNLDSVTSCGPSKGASIEREQAWLRRRAELISKDRWPDGTQVGISDFWLGQHLAYGRVWFDQADCAELEATWHAWQDRVVPPKLLVLLEKPLDPSAGLPTQRGNPHPSRRLDLLADGLRALFLRKGYGPILELDAARPDWALTELTAAVEAMA